MSSQSPKDKLLTLIVPTYNEHDNVVPLVERVSQALPGSNYRILFIDDNSRDGTAAMVRSLAARYPVEVIVRTDKRGLASAVVDGIGHAHGEIIAVIDADLQHPPEVLPDLLKAIGNGADIAIGSRYVAGGGCEGWRLTRRIISKGAIAICHFFLPSTRHIKDPVSGFFMFRSEVARGVDLRPTGYKILLEVLVAGKYRTVTEVPFVFRTRTQGESKLSAKTQIDYLKHIYSLMRRTGEVARFFKFAAVGASGIIVNEGLLYLLVNFGRMNPVAAQPIAVEASIISNFLLNNRFTFADRRSARFASTLASLFRYNLVSLAGLSINWLIFNLFYQLLGLRSALADPWGYLVANAIGIAVAFLANYILSNWWAWGSRKG